MTLYSNFIAHLKQQTISPQCVGCGSWQSNENLLCKTCYYYWIDLYDDQKTDLTNLKYKDHSVFFAYEWSQKNHHVFSELIYRMKAARCLPALEHYAKNLYKKLKAGNQIFEIDVIVPVPAKNGKKDHAFAIANKLAQLSGLPMQKWLVQQDIAKSEEETLPGAALPQKMLNRKDRIRPDRFCLALDREVITKQAAAFGSRVLLIDDVITTGETLKSCAEQLKFLGTPKSAALFYRAKIFED